MDELIAILDAEGNATGKTCLKSIVHKTGLYHATVHIWFYTTKGQIGKSRVTLDLGFYHFNCRIRPHGWFLFDIQHIIIV